MVQAIIKIPKSVNQILNIVKARHSLRTKSDAISMVVQEYGTNLLEPQLRPEYMEKLNQLEKQKGIPFKTMEELQKIIEG